MNITVAEDRCEGHGLCQATAPDVFTLDDEGVVRLVHPQVPAELREAAAAGVRVCPVAALRIHP